MLVIHTFRQTEANLIISFAAEGCLRKRPQEENLLQCLAADITASTG
jgi:hypothetical protein